MKISFALAFTDSGNEYFSRSFEMFLASFLFVSLTDEKVVSELSRHAAQFAQTRFPPDAMTFECAHSSTSAFASSARSTDESLLWDFVSNTPADSLSEAESAERAFLWIPV